MSYYLFCLIFRCISQLQNWWLTPKNNRIWTTDFASCSLRISKRTHPNTRVQVEARSWKFQTYSFQALTRTTSTNFSKSVAHKCWVRFVLWNWVYLQIFHPLDESYSKIWKSFGYNLCSVSEYPTRQLLKCTCFI